MSTAAKSYTPFFAQLKSASEWTAKERLKEFNATGADLLITACPYGRENSRKVLPEKDKNQVKDFVELVEERC